MNDDTSSAGELPSGTFIGRDAFRERVRAGLSAAAAEGWAELVLCDADFHDWPLVLLHMWGLVGLHLFHGMNRAQVLWQAQRLK